MITLGVKFTKATREILYWIQEQGFITNHICSRLFYKNKANGYSQAQVKLKNLYDNGVIKRYIHPHTKEFIYQYSLKDIDDHKKYICELYSRIYELSDEIIYSKLNEQTWKKSSRRNDAHIIYRIGDKVVGLLIEFDKFHKTSKEKLEQIYSSSEVQDWYKENYGVEDYFPTFVIITPLGNVAYKSDDWNCVGLDYDFTDLKDIL